MNGLWDYAITGKGDERPAKFEGSILVPYPLESSLSGVKKGLKPDQLLWYKRMVTIPAAGKNRVLLHFGAVDWQATVYVNNKEVGQHKGGYTAFTCDITTALRAGENELAVRVWDPTDKDKIAMGKQTLNPRTSFFTASSGIWQTVWMETVPAVSISELLMTPDVDNRRLTLTVNTRGDAAQYTLEATVTASGAAISAMKGNARQMMVISIPKTHLWSPADPFLYDLTVKLLHKGKVVDVVQSYFGMRKIEVKKDAAGVERIFLNNAYLFNLGVLDQGYWPEGCYAAPADSAFIFDISTLKNMGFNTIRKHLKVEPDRWYYHCDKLGMLVWQDMPCRYPRLKEDTKEAQQQFEGEMQAMMEQLYSHPSIVMWVPFNEDWASYDEKRIEGYVRQLDGSRLINTNSGSRKDGGASSGDLAVVHHYCYPAMPPALPGKARVLGEFGGVNVIHEGHEWIKGNQWGHGEMMPGLDFQMLYEDMMKRVKGLEEEGLSAAIFTQPYDVEQEQCGLMTYDRKIIKVSVESVRKINQGIVGGR